MALSPPPAPNLQTPTFLAPVSLLRASSLPLPALLKHTLRKLLAFVAFFTCAKSHKSCHAERRRSREINSFALSDNNNHYHLLSCWPVYLKRSHSGVFLIFPGVQMSFSPPSPFCLSRGENLNRSDSLKFSEPCS